MTKFFRIYSRRVNKMLPYIFSIGAMQWILSLIVGRPTRMSFAEHPLGEIVFDMTVVTNSFMYLALGIIMCVSAVAITVALLRIKDSRCNIEYGITWGKNIAFQILDFVVIAVAVVLTYIISWLCNSIVILIGFNEYLLSTSLFSVINTRDIFLYIPLFLSCIFCAYSFIINVHKMFATNKIYALITVGVNILVAVLYAMFITQWIYDNYNLPREVIDVVSSEWAVATVIGVIGLANAVSYALMEKYADITR